MSDPKSSIKVHQLGWVLVFAIVYADIGTSVFYVPSILYDSIGYLATLAQFICTGVFITIALKYVEICDRCPDGGGVVSIVREAFSALEFLPLVGGSFITVDYFLTSAISGVSGLYYLSSLMPSTKDLVLPASMILFLVLILVNIIGIKESASVNSTFATVEIAVILLLLGVSFFHIAVTPSLSFAGLWHSIIHPGVPLTVSSLAIGYATTWLAYSGLESVAQISGSMRLPVKSTANKAMWWVIGMIVVVSSPMTSVILYILPDEVKRAQADSFLSALGFTVGGPLLGLAVVLTASTLLFMACNTAIVGNYHVNVRLSDLGFLPSFLRKRHPTLGTPYLSILISGLVPMAIILITRANVDALGDLYNFGLLGTLSLSSLAIDRLRWRDGDRGFKFWTGAFTTLALLAAWFINMFHKPDALFFGGTLAVILVGVGVWHRIGAARKASSQFAAAEATVADLPEASNILTLEEALEASAFESSPIIVALRFVNEKLLEDAAVFARGMKKGNVYVIYIDEMPGLFLPQEIKPSENAVNVLVGSCAYLQKIGINAIPVWRMAEDAGTSLAEAATELKVAKVFVGSSKRTFFWRMVRGRMLKKLAQNLPESAELVIVG
ncbi:MAG TPA: APC family permease [bacterium]|nr:APC family permease [bacterium]